MENHYSEVLKRGLDHACEYLSEINTRSVFPDAACIAAMSGLDFELPDQPADPKEVIDLIHQLGSPATVATNGGRYFGFVIGAALPVALAASYLSGAWDQCAGLKVLSPISEQMEIVAGRWIREILSLPVDAGVGFVTGATQGNLTGLAAARHALHKQMGWNVEAQGLFAAPEIQVVVGHEVHVSILKALALLGFGSERVVRIPVDGQGRIDPDSFEFDNKPTIVCLQAGNVNTGAVDPMMDLIPKAKQKGAWVHVDGAFGLWAAASTKYSHLVKGVEMADSWSVDLHKWLNVPYDSGVVICRHPEILREAMSVNAAYLPGGTPGPYQYTPGMSRKARGVEAYAALYQLGKSGVAELVERCCEHAQRMAAGIIEAGYQVLNKVELNQVLIDFGPNTDQIIKAIQQEGTCWAGGTNWHGKKAMRISISSWATSQKDIDLSLESILKIAGKMSS